MMNEDIRISNVHMWDTQLIFIVVITSEKNVCQVGIIEGKHLTGGCCEEKLLKKRPIQKFCCLILLDEQLTGVD